MTTSPRTVVSSALLSIVLLAAAVTGCDGGTPPPPGGLGPVIPGGKVPGGSTGNGPCGVPQGSCRDASICAEVSGLAAADVAEFMTDCTSDGATWSSGGCGLAASAGGCRLMQEGMCAFFWFTGIPAADAMGQCALIGGTWVTS
jgi:hypothetical protein